MFELPFLFIFAFLYSKCTFLIKNWFTFYSVILVLIMIQVSNFKKNFCNICWRKSHRILFFAINWKIFSYLYKWNTRKSSMFVLCLILLLCLNIKDKLNIFHLLVHLSLGTRTHSVYILRDLVHNDCRRMHF